MKYVWLNIATGAFSNTWEENSGVSIAKLIKEQKEIDPENKWKLIAYECLTDDNFHFCSPMKLK